MSPVAVIASILLGTFKANPIYAAIGTLGIVLAAVYMLWMVQRVFFGQCDKEENKKLLDMNAREIAIALPLIVLIFFIGVYPKPFISKIEPTVNKVIEMVQQKKALEIIPEITPDPELTDPVEHMDISHDDELQDEHETGGTE